MEHLAWYELLLLFFAASFLRDVWYYYGTSDGGTRRIAWRLAVFIFRNLRDCSGMDRRSSDRAVISPALVGLFRKEMESGRLYLPECFGVLGRSGPCNGNLGK